MRLGPIALRAGEQRLVEYTRSEPRALDGWTEHESWPVFVEGSSQGDSRLEFDAETSAHVRQAAMLVSLAWQEPWQVRSHAKSTRNLKPTIPESDPQPLPFLTGPIERDTMPSLLPEWLPAAWEQLEADERTARALLLWHEGFLVEPSHPSLALLAYTAAVEAISKSIWATKVIPGIAARPSDRFKSTIQLVADDVDSTEALEWLRWYKQRSETVHDGVIHGHELGTGPLLDFDMSVEEQPQSNFAIRTIPTRRSLTSQLIELSLRGLDPPER